MAQRTWATVRKSPETWVGLQGHARMLDYFFDILKGRPLLFF